MFRCNDEHSQNNISLNRHSYKLNKLVKPITILLKLKLDYLRVNNNRV